MAEPPRRFRDALEQARAEWTAADPARCAARAGCGFAAGGVVVPFFGRPHTVAHPGGVVSAAGATRPVHAAVTIALLHYLLRADGTPVADHWVAFRELPDGLFYATSFAQRAEQPIARVFASAAGIPRDELSGGPSAAVRGLHGDEPRHGLGALRRAAEAAGGRLLGLGDVSFSFTALPRVPLAVVVWAGDDELPADASILFDETAGHYLPAEDLAGLGESLSRTLVGS